MHNCPMATPGVPPVPHTGGPVITGAPTVIVAFVPQARISDQCTCVGPPDVIVKGSPTVIMGGMPAARLGDTTAHGGVITTGAPNVLIGESGYVSSGTGGIGDSSRGETEATLPDIQSSPNEPVEAPEMLGSATALRAPAKQARTLRQAAADGAPFVQMCGK
jgi:uncharacterized Zn-binding protein involved in type VI secretion